MSDNPPTADPKDHMLGIGFKLVAGHRVRLDDFGKACIHFARLLAEIEKTSSKRKRARLTWEIVELTCTDTTIAVRVQARRQSDLLAAIERMYRKVAS